MLSLGGIEEPTSPWRSPPMLVPKPDGSLRFCIDFRCLNEVTLLDAYPTTHIDNLLDKIPGAQVLSTLDLTNGYWQIPIAPSDKQKTAFATSGLYQFTKMPFGHNGITISFQRVMDKALRGVQDCALVYIDDILIFSPSTLRLTGLTVNLKKSKLGQQTIQYLGFCIGQGKIWAVPNKMADLQEILLPPTKKDLQRFLGLAITTGWCHSFQPGRGHSPISSQAKAKGRSSLSGPWSPKKPLRMSVRPYAPTWFCTLLYRTGRSSGIPTPQISAWELS